MSLIAGHPDSEPARGAFVPRIVVLDLDGTTIDYRQRLHPRIRKAVRSVATRLPVIVATGRMYRSALPWASELGTHEPLVCYQGALVREAPRPDGSPGLTIFEQPLEAAAARRALAVARRIRTGTVGVNGGAWFGPEVPFGGYKQSGVGREMGAAGLEEFLETKSLAIPVS